MDYFAFEDASKQKIINWSSGGVDTDCFEFTGNVEFSDERWYDYYYSFPDFMREFLPVPTYAPSVKGEIKKE